MKIVSLSAAATSEEQNERWVIHLQGGGECSTKASCYGELNQAVGSSKYFSESISMGFLCRDTSDNPDWGMSNHVFIPYCTGDLHSGTVVEPTDESFQLYFAGHMVFEAVVCIKYFESIQLSISPHEINLCID